MVKADSQLPFYRSNLKVRASPSGIHVFNRSTGLNILFDEVRVPAAMWAGAPRQVSIALTNECDLACPYCFVPKNHTVLDFGQVTNWLNELDCTPCYSWGQNGSKIG